MMRIIFIIILVSTFSNNVFAQLFKSQKNNSVFFVNIKNNTAHVEIFNKSRHFIEKYYDKILFSGKKDNDTIYTGTRTHILKRKDNYFLLYKSKHRGNTKKIKLKVCDLDNRRQLRKEAYNFETEVKIRKLQDSLSGPNNLINVNVNTFRNINIDSISECDYLKKVDNVADSLANRIKSQTNPIVDSFYRKINSITKLDSVEIYKLLSDANYKFHYSQYLLYKLSIENPECLISYVDENPPNKDFLLRAIKNHTKHKEIIINVKETNLATYGKKQIMKQKPKRILTNIAFKSIYMTIIITELALITVAAIWIL